jgi:hypothetical protein
MTDKIRATNTKKENLQIIKKALPPRLNDWCLVYHYSMISYPTYKPFSNKEQKYLLEHVSPDNKSNDYDPRVKYTKNGKTFVFTITKKHLLNDEYWAGSNWRSESEQKEYKQEIEDEDNSVYDEVLKYVILLRHLNKRMLEDKNINSIKTYFNSDALADEAIKLRYDYNLNQPNRNNTIVRATRYYRDDDSASLSPVMADVAGVYYPPVAKATKYDSKESRLPEAIRVRGGKTRKYRNKRRRHTKSRK